MTVEGLPKGVVAVMPEVNTVRIYYREDIEDEAPSRRLRAMVTEAHQKVDHAINNEACTGLFRVLSSAKKECALSLRNLTILGGAFASPPPAQVALSIELSRVFSTTLQRGDGDELK